MSTASRQPSNPAHTLLIVGIATIATIVLGLIPFAGVLTYPLRLFATFIHETGHVLATLVSFGDVHWMKVNLDSSGVTITSGGSRFLIGSAGYLGTTLFGAAMLMSARSINWSRWALGLVGCGIVVVTSLYGGRSSALLVLCGAMLGMGLLAVALLAETKIWIRGLAGAAAVGSLLVVMVYLFATDGLLTWLLGLGSGVALLVGAKVLTGDSARFATSFLGLSVGLDALSDVWHLIGLSTSPFVHTDAHNMARDFGLPAIVWALSWTGMSVVLMLAVVGFLIWDYRRLAHRS